jgi:hypothetical protein
MVGFVLIAAGCSAVMITVDCAVLGRRLNEARNDFRIPEHLDLPCLPADCNWRDLVTDDDRLKFGTLDWAHRDDSKSDTSVNSPDAGVTWQNLIGWARENTTMQIWLKGGALSSSTATGIALLSPLPSDSIYGRRRRPCDRSRRRRRHRLESRRTAAGYRYSDSGSIAGMR